MRKTYHIRTFLFSFGVCLKVSAMLTALQGGLLLTQIRREPSPLEAALDAMIDHIESLRSHERE